MIIHPSWQLATKVVGRGTCKNPNLQQVSKSLRSIYRAKPGNKLTWADYEQFHIRIIAWLSQDENLLKACEGDVHTEIGKMIFNVEELPSKKRDITKIFDLGRFYGGQAPTLWAQTVSKFPELTLRFVETLCQKIDKAFPRVVEWQKESINKGYKHGYAECPLNGRRFFFYGKPEASICINFPVISIEAEVANRAVKAIDAELDWEKESIALHCHDELALEGPDTEAGEKRREGLLRKHMEQTLVAKNGTKVTFPIDMNHGHNWGK